MTHYEINYSSDYPTATREQRDAQAIADTIDYVGGKGYLALVDYIHTGKSAQSVNLSMAILMGISGRPFYAIMRAHNLFALKLWMSSDEGGPAIAHDDLGFFGDERRLALPAPTADEPFYISPSVEGY